jgi:type IV pilus assembly protein PilE
MKIVSADSRQSAVQGFTLVELMIVIAIVGILAAIAVPAYREHVVKTNRSDAMAVLQGFAQAMERHYAQNNTYAGAAVGPADTGTPANYSPKSPIEGAARYDLTIEAADATGYTLRAAPAVGGGQEGNGLLEITNTGQRSWDRNDNGAIDAGENTWSAH